MLVANLLIISVLTQDPQGAQAAQAALTINPGQVTGKIDPHIRGHFLKHICHFADDRLFGELVQNAFPPPLTGVRPLFHGSGWFLFTGPASIDTAATILS